MKKIYFLLLVLCSVSVAKAQVISFLDFNFKDKLLQSSTSNTIAKNAANANIKIDANGDNEIDVAEAGLVYSLSVPASNISSLDGIQHFVNLRNLICFSNDLITIDVSSLSNLKTLDCTFQSPSLTSLNVSGLSNLVTLNCQLNRLSSLNLNGLTSLQELTCYNQYVPMPTLDLQGLPNLKLVECYGNNIVNLNLTGVSSLLSLDCSNNDIVNLDVSDLINLQFLNCNNNDLSILDLSNNINLDELECHNNQLQNLEVNHIAGMNSLICSNNQLTSLNLSGMSVLFYLSCTNNPLNNLNLSGLTNIENLYCDNTSLTTLATSSLSDLEEFSCSNTLITDLDLSNSPFLTYLKCDTNPNLTYLNVKNGAIENQNGNATTFQFNNNPNLSFICADEVQVNAITDRINLYGYSNCHANSYCSFVPGGVSYLVKGVTKFDSNYNGNCSQVADALLPKMKFTISSGAISGSVFANFTGNYGIPVGSGIHTLVPVLEVPSYFLVSPSNLVVNFPTQASPFTQNFCVTANGTHTDLEIAFVPTEPARPGFDVDYKLIYRNKGTHTQSGTLNLNFDDTVLDLISASPVVTSQTLNQLSWNFVNLKPFETREISLTLNVNSPAETPAVNGGDILHYTASISSTATDETPADNTFTLNQTVVNSYDPNDKTCLEGTTITPSEVGKYVHYLIRFENTGTYPAENIVVKDIIDTTKFDVSTLVPIKGSHDFYTRINGNKVEFIFENINLPFDDANNDGYVAFKIKTKPTLVNGDTFSNSASIYFDYNFPIVTNTATTTIQALGTQDFQFGQYFNLYPNPVNNVLNIETKQTIEVSSISIYNQLGQLVVVVPNAQNVKTVDVSSLAAGNYFIKINSNKGTSNAKFVKR